ncbi:MDR family MFS transporter [Streptomyces orinoci]|uniref:MDR family MFS transporter n=1 Tax=Streptomyces orinoci TaxID=67339 RepID=A0ABV3K533_STRON|nr:MDR family MFS transporter [Streptomyces orinoci]
MPQEPAPGATPTPRATKVVIGAVVIAMLLASLDNLILGSAMPTIVSEFGGLDHLSWVASAYMLATAAATPLWGKFGDMYGRKGTFLSSIAIFLAGSAASGLSQSMGQLIAFRAVQGLGAGGLMVGALSLMAALIPPAERGKYQALISGAMGVAMVGGPVAGGFITDHLGWRWCFYVNLPLGVLALALLVSWLHLPQQRSQARVDYAGAVLLTTAISALVLLSTWGGTEYPWTSPVIATLAVVFLAATALFLAVERRAAEPVLPPHLFRDRNLSLANAIAFLMGCVMVGAMTFLPLFQQTVQGASATNSGLLMLPMVLGIVGANLTTGQLATRTARYRLFLVAGSALLVAGVALMLRMDVGTGRTETGCYMAVLGIGVGLLMQNTIQVAMESVELKDLGVASSSVTLSRTLGGTLGVAVAGAVFSHQVRRVMADRLGASAGRVGGGSSRLDAASLNKLPSKVRSAYEHAVAGGIHQVFLYASAVGLVSLAVSWFVRNGRRDRSLPEPPADRPAPDHASSAA